MSSTRGQKAAPTARAIDPDNRLNDLNSQRWLTFQKSWFIIPRGRGLADTAAEFIAFFTKQFVAPNQRSRVGLLAENLATLQPVISALGRQPVILHGHTTPDSTPALDYCLIDLSEAGTIVDEHALSRWQARITALAPLLKNNAYLTVFVRNQDAGGLLQPFAWLLGKAVGQTLSLKDEKIGCEERAPDVSPSPVGWSTLQNVVYCLNFRREEQPPEAAASPMDSGTPTLSVCASGNWPLVPPRPSWMIVKPPPREKHVLLHPGKFPEALVEIFLKDFTRPGDRVLDPMTGTGSALLAALALGREAYGIELNPAFHRVAHERITQYLPALPGLLDSPSWRLVCGDATTEASYRELPARFDYIITSPPYWDMLRMKGAETQQKRKAAGLPRFYSDDNRDLGNLDDYPTFLAKLIALYRMLATRLNSGRYFTIIVKNVKKRGRMYPLAWDLALALRRDLTLCHEQFWCQNDQKLAPFGYRYAWVSNTFHHYCLHFRKP
ncbi:MAG: DNA methyltransferase [candidate division KSB1 bacterium]|nr:DNA methyltransferase [candidate division KSB1 bacterium]MDZ7273868.1 DNA methyltransferase [candidate division KSB1 bacterium]MDZ7286024.1 DNA methyltransferase [candidate division KSB1 bacterium]MDZ7299056.1 DNA methyltransferase [candidate division KSB1 bacterium]MDZ7308193.1 DNA methyltransferase [candidate division KSB1 bacterium]